MTLSCSFRLDQAAVTRLFVAASQWNRTVDGLVQDAIVLLTRDLDLDDVTLPNPPSLSSKRQPRPLASKPKELGSGD